MVWNLIYSFSDDDTHFEEFVKSLNKATISKVTRMINLLESSGNLLRMPYSKKITKDIFELRIRGTEEVRILYVFGKGRTIHLLHGFKKKTQKTPAKEIKLAKLRIRQVNG